MKGHAALPSVRAMPDISVIGPMARSAQDLRTALNLLAGPNPIAARGYKLNMPDLGLRKLSDLRIGIWRSAENFPVAKDVEARVDLVTSALRDAGAQIDESSRPGFETQESHRIYQHLLHATMASRMPDENYSTLVEHVKDLNQEDDSEAARVFEVRFHHFEIGLRPMRLVTNCAGRGTSTLRTLML